MKIVDETTKTARCTKYLCCATMLLGLLGTQGCSMATLAGCGTGVATGVALAGIAAASAGSNNSGSVDVGTAMLGGSIFGVVSGCSAAAVADAVARSSEREKARRVDAVEVRQEPAPRWDANVSPGSQFRGNAAGARQQPAVPPAYPHPVVIANNPQAPPQAPPPLSSTAGDAPPKALGPGQNESAPPASAAPPRSP
jgi:hypothetical protein